jgi:signal transduction histidine kinase
MLLRKLIEAPHSRWLSLWVLALVAVFAGSAAYSSRVSSRVDEHVKSIAQNGAPGVTRLATVTEDLRLMSESAMRARNGSLVQARESVAAHKQEMNFALEAYRATGDYPGERDLYRQVETKLGPFFRDIDDVLASIPAPAETHAASVQRLEEATTALMGSVGELTRFNADHVTEEMAAITRIRTGSRRAFIVLRSLSLLLAVAGVFLASSASRQHAALAEKAKRLAEERATEMELFAGRVAHDLRAPLTVIQMRGTVAGRSDSPDLLKEALERILRQSHRMDAMIEALLTFARAGARTTPGSCSDIAAVIGEVVAENRSLADDPSISCVVERLPQAAVACSPSVLTILLSNLVRNAIKYIGDAAGKEKRVTVSAEARKDTILFEVSDTGPGLPPGSEIMVFEPFVRLDSTAAGIGLGLATVKRLVEGHGGKVGVHSLRGEGCRFWFELPRDNSVGAEETPDPSAPRLVSAAGASAASS